MMYLKILIQDQGLTYQMDNSPLLPKIFITNDPGLLESFTNPNRETPPTSFTKFIDEYTKTDSYQEKEFIYLDIENTNLINFEYTLGGTGAAKEDCKVVIEFIPVKEEFEFLSAYTSLNRSKNKQNKYNDFPKDIFYLLFGVTDDLAYWSPFLTLTLFTTATFQNFDEPRSVQLNFGISSDLPTILQLYNQKLAIKSADILGAVSIYSRENFRIFTKPEFEIYNFLSKEAEETFNILKNEGEVKQALLSEPGIKVGARPPREMTLISNSRLLAQYLYGFSYIDAFYKAVINQYLRTFFFNATTVFFVTEDLGKLALRGTEYEKYEILLKTDPPHLQISSDVGYGTDSATEKFKIYYNTLTTIANRLDKDLTTETTAPAAQVGLFSVDVGFPGGDVELEAPGPVPQGSIAFEVMFDPEDDTLLDNKIKLLKDKVKSLVNGLEALCGESVDIIQESDAEVLGDFYNNLRGGAWDAYTTANSNPEKLKPIIFIGPKRLIRAMLYGERSKVGGPKNYLGGGTELPTNVYAEYRNLLRVRTKPRQLYESRLTKEDQLLLENSPFFNDTESFQRSINEDYWPIFRYNFPNPNVLSLKSEENYLTNTLLFGSFSQSSRFYDEFSVTENTAKKNLELQKEDAKNRVLEKLISLLGVSNGSSLQEFLALRAQLKINLSDAGKYRKEISSIIKDQNFDLFELVNQAAKKGLIKSKNAETYNLSGLSQENESTITIEGLSESTIDVLSTILTYLFNNQEFATDYIESHLVYDSTSEASPAVFYSRLYDAALATGFLVEIDTLPFFNISGPRSIGLPCFLLANRIDVVGDQKTDLLDNIITGVYIITGVSHRINDTVCETKISLARQGVPRI